MDRRAIKEIILSRGSFLCVGLDTDPALIPEHLRTTEDPVFEFNKAIIDATRPYCVAYKPNTAFYESEGTKGWASLDKTVRYIGNSHFTIADAKRGDIGNTAHRYAKAFFKSMPFDAVTVAPYMGRDSITPFLQEQGKWAVLLALTSNEGAADFQLKRLESGSLLCHEVLKTSLAWGSPENMMYVVGATRPEMIGEIRKLAPEHFLLVPGVGAQGGNLEAVCEQGLNADVGLLINASRSILYASAAADFAEAASREAKKISQVMRSILSEKGYL